MLVVVALSLAALPLQARPNDAYRVPVSNYLDCIATETKRVVARKDGANADAVVSACESLFGEAIVAYATMVSETDGGLDYRARYLRRHGRDPDLVAMLAPGLRGSAREVAVKMLGGAKGDVEAQFKFTLPNPDKDDASPAASPVPPGGRPAAPASETR